MASATAVVVVGCSHRRYRGVHHVCVRGMGPTDLNVQWVHSLGVLKVVASCSQERLEADEKSASLCLLLLLRPILQGLDSIGYP
jgi:hypothetical protein